MIAAANTIAWLFIASVFATVAWLIFDTHVGAKSAGPPPHIPPGLDLDAFRAKVHGDEGERRGRG